MVFLISLSYPLHIYIININILYIYIYNIYLYMCIYHERPRSFLSPDWFFLACLWVSGYVYSESYFKMFCWKNTEYSYPEYWHILNFGHQSYVIASFGSGFMNLQNKNILVLNIYNQIKNILVQIMLENVNSGSWKMFKSLKF